MNDQSKFRALTYAQAALFLAKKQNTLIVYHANPDADAIGSAFALKLMLEALGMRAYCVCSSGIPKRYRFLTNGIQERALYETIPADFTDYRIITVDTAAPVQMGPMAEPFGGRVSLMIDHHASGTPYADYLVDEGAAATGEILFDLMRIWMVNNMMTNMSSRVYSLLYAAISGDTGCFRYQNVTPDTLRRAAALLEYGVPCADINYYLFEVKSDKVLKAEHEGFNRLQTACGGKLAMIKFPYEAKVRLVAADTDLETLIDVARSVEDTYVAAVIKQNSESLRFRVSLRSSVDIDVAAICEKFGGGGHKRAAGCTMYADHIDMAADRIIEEISRAIAEYESTKR